MPKVFQAMSLGLRMKTIFHKWFAGVKFHHNDYILCHFLGSCATTFLLTPAFVLC